MNVDLLIHDAAQVVTCAGGARRGATMGDAAVIPNAAVAVCDGTVALVGPAAEVRAACRPRETLDAAGRVVCPGFVDPHTHLVYAGDRIAEFELRIKGASYMEIMNAGGGIVSTMKATRAAPVERLVAESRRRLDTMLALGTTTAEVKTGYGLDRESELKMLEAAARLNESHAAELVPTFLGAHAVPPEYAGRPDDFIDHVITSMLPPAAEWYASSPFAARGLPFFCDVFCEENVFDRRQAERVLRAGLECGLAPKIHADEFKNLGGASLAVELGAVSADHLDVTPREELESLAASATVAVVLPAVNFNLGSTRFANARLMIDMGVALALATDINPGSAPCPSMPLVMSLACRYQHLLPSEAMVASTINAAHAIGLGERLGSIEAGKQADLVIVDSPDYRHLAYQFGSNLVTRVIKKGRIVV